MLKAYAVALALSTSAPVAEKQEDTVQNQDKKELVQTVVSEVKDGKGRKGYEGGKGILF